MGPKSHIDCKKYLEILRRWIFARASKASAIFNMKTETRKPGQVITMKMVRYNPSKDSVTRGKYKTNHKYCL